MIAVADAGERYPEPFLLRGEFRSRPFALGDVTRHLRHTDDGA